MAKKQAFLIGRRGDDIFFATSQMMQITANRVKIIRKARKN